VLDLGDIVRTEIDRAMSTASKTLRLALVTKASPLELEFLDDRQEIDEDDLDIGAWANYFMDNSTFAVGDTVLVAEKRDGGNIVWVLVDFLTDEGDTFAVASDSAKKLVDGSMTLQKSGTRWQSNSEFETPLSVYSYVATSAQIHLGNNAGVPIIRFGNAADTTLHRPSAGLLATDGIFRAGSGTAGTGLQIGDDLKILDCDIANTARLQGAQDATTAVLQFGSAGDTNLYRAAADTLKTDDKLVVGVNTLWPDLTGLITIGTGGTMIRNFLTGADANPSIYIASNGSINWGAGGATAVDTNLYRGGVSLLRTDDDFAVGTHTGVVGGQGMFVQSLGRIVLGRLATTNSIFQAGVNGDTAEHRFSIFADGKHEWGDGALTRDTNLYRLSPDILGTDDDFAINVAGKGLRVKEGSNAKMGTATLVAGAVTISTTAVTANSRIFYSVNVAGGTQGILRVSARTAGTSFVITSTSGTETSSIVWMLVEPA
jgi:hypothetical protein